KTTLLVCFFFLPALLAVAQEKSRQSSAGREAIGHGKYIVEQVAMCIECHTPRNEKGELLKDRYLEGAPVPVKAPPYPIMRWALKAPAIAGLPGYTKEEGVRLLTEGITRDGKTPSPPMPPFRLNSADAQAVVAYLKTLR
ncbi:MAG: c-type cytochrome, partial [Candidatus Binatia bacterium]